MKKIYCLVTFLAALLMMQSCGFEEKNLFPDSSANRITAKTEEYTTLLESAPKGWLLHYGTGGSELSGGGENLLVTFKDGNATISTDAETNVPAWQEETAPYSINMETGPVLSFDVYNPVLHYFTEPHPTQLKGQEADFEFIIMKATDDTLILQGKKYHTKLYMTRLADDFDVAAFKSGVDAVKNGIYYMDYAVKSGDKALGQLGLSESGNLLSGTVDNRSVTLPFVYTSTGIQFLDTLQVDGKAITAMKYDTKSKVFSADGITLNGLKDEAYEKFAGDYLFHADQWAGVDVTLTPLKYTRTYKMTGYSYNGTPVTIIVKYETGRLAFAAQTFADAPELRMCFVGQYWQQYNNEEMVSQPVEGVPGDYLFVTNGVGTSYGFAIGTDNGTGTMWGFSDYKFYLHPHLTRK